jgi:hypothetical protein
MRLAVFVVGTILSVSGCAHMQSHVQSRSFPYLNGKCPSEFPIKGNIGSYGKIAHARDSAYYDLVDPEMCFLNEEAAATWGYRLPYSK